MMNCDRLQQQLDDYVDDALPATDAHALRQHIGDCAPCQQVLARERQLRDLLRNYGEQTAPVPTPAYLEKALQQAAHSVHEKQRRRSWLTGFASAAAAGLAIWFVSVVMLSGPADAPVSAGVPLVAMTVEEPHTVNLVFSSAVAMDEATLTVTLPAGLQLTGFEDRHEITWSTSLQQGKNILPLQLLATGRGSGELLATLKHGEDDRTFRLRIEIS